MAFLKLKPKTTLPLKVTAIKDEKTKKKRDTCLWKQVVGTDAVRVNGHDEASHIYVPNWFR